MHPHILYAVATAFVATVPAVSAAGLYPKSSAVLQVDAKDYDRLIAKSNQTSVRHSIPKRLITGSEASN